MIKKFKLPMFLILSFLVLSNTGSSTENNTLIVTNTISKSSTSYGMTSTGSNTPSSAAATNTTIKKSSTSYGMTSTDSNNSPNTKKGRKVKKGRKICHKSQCKY